MTKVEAVKQLDLLLRKTGVQLSVAEIQKMRVKDIQLMVAVITKLSQQNHDLGKELYIEKERNNSKYTGYDQLLTDHYAIPKRYAKTMLTDAILTLYPEEAVDIESSVKMSIGVLEEIEKQIKRKH